MGYIDSNNFSVKVNRQNISELGENGRFQCVIEAHKGGEKLSPVESNPGEGQFSVEITSTEKCVAFKKDLNIIYANELMDDIGIIVLNIMVEGKSTIIRSIKLIKAIASDEVLNIEKRISIAEQKITEDAIVSTVRKEFYTKGETNTQMSLVTQEVDNWGVRIVENENDISSLKLTNKEFEVVIGNKADTGNIISMINASTEGITISSSKVDIEGYVTFYDLSHEGYTTINGANITTGYISGDRIQGGVISATDEINFVGGARIFGNAGEHGAGLTISASGFHFSGGSHSYLGGDWSVGGDLEASGDISFLNGYCSSISVTGDSYIGSAGAWNLEVTKWIACDSMNASSLAVAGMSYLTDVSCSSLTVNGTSVTSDERLKTDIKYVNVDNQEISNTGLMSPNVNITTDDMHEFIENLPLVSYRLIEELNQNKDNTYYGFIIQDIMETKVGSELIEYPKDEYGNEVDGYYSYSQNKFIAFICGALQEEIKRSKELENRVLALEDKLNKEE